MQLYKAASSDAWWDRSSSWYQLVIDFESPGATKVHLPPNKLIAFRSYIILVQFLYSLRKYYLG